MQQKSKVINKIAFLVHEPTMYAHYSSVWARMERNSFTILLLGGAGNDQQGHGVNTFLDKIDKLGYEVDYLDKIIEHKIKYQYVVSNHILGGESPYPAAGYQAFRHKTKNAIKRAVNLIYRSAGITKRYRVNWLDPVQYPPLQAGIKQIRFMYGADISDAWSLDGWNEIYDLFLCHGPNDDKRIKERFKGKTAIMGYPRYDAYFSSDLCVKDVISEFDIDRNKQTILWMPTLDMPGDSLCSIIPFAKAIADLGSDFNLIVRPHPISFRKTPDAIELLESLEYKIDRDPTRDMNELFKVADFVLCDHGGSAFGALYLGKRLILLKSPNYGESKMVKGSSNLVLMKYFPFVSVAEVASLRTVLNDSEYWGDALEKAKSLSHKYFADYKGTSSLETAKILKDLLTNEYQLIDEGNNE